MPQNKTVKVNLTEDERTKVENALTSIDTLKTNAKRQMARAKIVDLSKVSFEENGAKPASKTEHLNYLVVEARQKINNAMNVLFSNDCRLKSLQSCNEIQRMKAVAENKEIPGVERPS